MTDPMDYPRNNATLPGAHALGSRPRTPSVTGELSAMLAPPTPGPATPTGRTAYLSELSALVGRGFGSTREALEAILKLLTEQLGMRTSFFARIARAEGRFKMLAAYNAPGGCGLEPGTVAPLANTYCSSIAGSVEPSPLLIADTRHDPAFAAHPAGVAFPAIRSYLGVPLLLADGTFFGTLCAVDPAPRALTPDQADLLVVLARLLATQIERDRELVERRRTEEALRVSEQRYRSVVDSISEVIFQTDPAGCWTLLNPAWTEITGFTIDESLGRPLIDFVHPDDRQRCRHYLRALVDSRDDDRRFVTRALTRTDQVRTVEVLARLTLAEDGTVAGLAGTLTDITARTRAEAEITEALATQRAANEQLERLNKVKSDLVSIVSHEFRTALTTVQGFSELMRDEDLDLKEMKDFAADINRDAKRLNRMITEMLDLDRMESGRMKLNQEQVDLNELLREVGARQGLQAPKHPFQIDLDQRIPPLAGDRDKLTQVMTNLVSNAIKYSPNGGPVTITSQLLGSQIHLCVRDSGVGIIPDALETIFDPYFRIESGATRHIRGTGLGLAIARQIVTLHGGRVWAESTLGEGAVFHVMLPVTTRPGWLNGAPSAG